MKKKSNISKLMSELAKHRWKYTPLNAKRAHILKMNKARQAKKALST